MKSPGKVEQAIIDKWDREEIGLDEFVTAMMRCGWYRDDIYDWLCGGNSDKPRLNKAHWSKQFHQG